MNIRLTWLVYVVSIGLLASAGAQSVYGSDADTGVVFQTGHNDGVSALAFSPDRRFLASAGKDRTIRIWDLGAFRVIRTLTGHKKEVTALAFSPDGKLLASAGEDGTIRVWNPAAEWSSTILAGTGTPIFSIVFSNDGRLLISGDLSGFITIRDTSTGAETQRLKDHGVVNALAVSPTDGTIIASGTSAIGAGGENAAHIWDLSNGKEAYRLAGYSGRVTKVLFSPDGRVLLADSSEDGYKGWDPTSGTELRRPDLGVRHPIGFLQNGQLLTSGVLRVFLSRDWTGAGAKIIDGPDASTSALSNDATLLATANFLSGDVRLWNIGTEKEIPLLSQPKDSISAVAISPDSHWLASVGFHFVSVWDLPNGNLALREYDSDEITNVIFSPDGQSFATWGFSNNFTVWDRRSGKKRFSAVGHQGRITCVKFDPLGDKIASASDDHTIRVWDGASGTLLRTINAYAETVTSVTYTNDGRHIVSSGAEIKKSVPDFNDRSSVKVWDADTGRMLSRFVSDGLESLGGELLIAGDRHLFISTHFKSIWLQDATTGRVSKELDDGGVVKTIATSPNGRWVVSGDDVGAIRIWDISTGYQIRALPIIPATINSIAIADSAMWLAAATADGRITMWDLKTGELLGTLFSFRDAKDWLVVAGGTRYNGSAGGEAQILNLDRDASIGGPVQDAHALWSSFSTATRWSTVNTRANAPPEVDLHLPPGFDPDNATSGTVVLTLHVSAAARTHGADAPLEGIREVRLQRNQETLRIWSNDLRLGKDGQADIQEEVPISSGQNEFSAFATTASGIKSAVSRVRVVSTSLAPELVIQRGHSGTINDVRFSPDGSLIASGGQDRAIVLWNSRTGQQVRRLVGHSQAVMSISFSPDGALLASSGSDNEVILWRVANGQRLRTLVGHSKSVISVAFSPNGRMLATGSQDYTVGLWDVASGREIRTLEGHEALVGCVAFSPDGRLLASASLDKTVRIWEVATGRSLKKLVHTQGVAAVVFSPKTHTLISGEQFGTIRFWNTDNWNEVRRLERAATLDVPDDKKPFLLDALSFSPDGRWIASADGFLLDIGLAWWLTVNDASGTIKVFDANSGQLVREIKDRIGVTFKGICFKSDGQQMVWADSEGQIELASLSQRPDVTHFSGSTSGVGSLAINANGTMLASGSTQIHLWDLSAGRATRAFDPNETIDAIAFDPAGDKLVSESQGGMLRFWNLSSGTNKAVNQAGQEGHTIDSVAYSQDGKWVATTGNKENGVKLWDASSGQLKFVLGGIDRGELLNTGSFSDDSSMLVSASSSLLTEWDVVEGKQLHSIDTGQTNLWAAIFSPDRRSIATAGVDGVSIWNVATGTQEDLVFDPAGSASTIAFNSRGDLLAWAGSDSTIKISDPHTGKLVRTLSGHESGVSALKFLPRQDPSRTLLASAGLDGSIRLWDVGTGESLATLLNPGRTDDWVVVTPDGLFDGTANGIHQVAWRIGDSNNVSAVDAFFTDFYRPGLLAEILSGAVPRATVDIATALQIPGLRNMLVNNLAHPETHGNQVVICFNEKPGAAINIGPTDQRLFFPPVNGFRPGTTGSCKFEKVLSTAGLNASKLLKQLQNWKAEVVTTPWDGRSSDTTHSTLHILTIGVSEYASDSRFPQLPWAVPSAKAIEAFFRDQQSSARKPYATVRVWNGLYNKDATRDHIQETLLEMAKQIKEDDVVLIYFAGHGQVSVGSEMFYFVSADKQSLDLQNTALSTAMIAEALRNMPARRIMLIVDACQSGGAIEALSKIGSIKAQIELLRIRQEHGAPTDDNGIGMHLIAATLPLSYAAGPANGESVLAETLLKALSLPDLQVTADRVSNYVKDQLPSLSKAREGFRQIPLIDSIGLDFPLR
jgi:WD40 repeat protein